MPCPSEIKDPNIAGYDSLTSALAQEYEECAVKAEYDHQLRLVQHLSSGFVRCTEMINQEPNSASRMTSKSPIPTPLISSTPAKKFFYERFTSEIPNNLPRYVAAKVCSKFFNLFFFATSSELVYSVILSFSVSIYSKLMMCGLIKEH